MLMAPPPSTINLTPLLELRGISKIYGNLRANDEVSIEVHAGSITALLGENGAGKSTLLKTIAGSVLPDTGVMLWDGREVLLSDRRAVADLSIAMVHQHFSLFETLTVGENIALSIQLPALVIAARIKALCASYGWDLSPDTAVYSLSYGERQQVEIIRCLMRDPNLLILDEPTSVLSPNGIEKLFGTLRQLATEGRAILFTSHKLDEVRELCHSAIIMRRGKTVGTAIPSQVSARELAEPFVTRDH
jgi:general nucleoside transport system ATP-binding protein